MFNPIDTAPVHDFHRAMVARHDDVTPIIKSKCREWHGIEVWPVLLVRYEYTNPIDKLFKIVNAHLPVPNYMFINYQPELYANR